MTPRPGAEGAVVARVDFGGCTLMTDGGESFDATVRPSLMGRKKALGNLAVVGDRVRVEWEGERAIIEEVEPRRNAFSRRAAGGRPEEQVVATNLDQVVLVTALVDPPFREGLVDRVLCQAEHAGIPARLVLNKVDLGSQTEARAIVADYGRAGYPTHIVCAKSGEGVDAVLDICLARRSLFIGHSGVGKSTLLNGLVPDAGLLAGDVNLKTGKGRHTTTAALLLRPAPDFELIDTPGMRAFGLWGIGPNDLEQSYAEFRAHLGHCKFGDCRHVKEPGCALRAAVASRDIPQRRYDSFLKLRDELENEEPEENPRKARR